SAVLLHLAVLAFAPARLPSPVMHVDTGHNFPEVIEYRDGFVQRVGARLVIASVQESIDTGRVVEDPGPRASRNRLQSVTLLDAITEHGFDAAFGGGRRDEDRARAEERILSFRDHQGRWDPRNQRPDVARGDVLVAGVALPTEVVSGHVCWMIDAPLRAGSRYWFKHGTRVGRATVDAVEYRHDLHTLEPISADQIELNDLAMVRLSLSEPIVASPYEVSREGGRLILVDEATNTTAGAMMITVAA
ncbi:MAG: phosphoadenosine phosphosulfate reductase family protein, partial [Ilumatobacteraceae bacterium]